MALTTEQENDVLLMLTAFKNGKRINELNSAQGAVKDMAIEVQDETGETHKMELADAVTQANNPIAGRVWNEDNSTSVAAGYYGSLQALRDLPTKLGLGRYLVANDRTRRKLDPTNSNKFADGTPAALDGSMGQCMWCWNEHYYNWTKQGNLLIKAITFNNPIAGWNSYHIPAGGISWMDAGVIDRTNLILCSVINNTERYRGGAGVALTAASYTKAPVADSPQLTMLGMPATVISTTNLGTYARKRGEGWESNWFVARAVVEYVIEIIMGNENVQSAFNSAKDSNGLYQGGFGTGVTDMPDWINYNGTYPVIPTSVGLDAGDGVCLVDYNLPDAVGTGVYKNFKVPVFFGLVNASFGNLNRWVRGIIMNAGDTSDVYVTKSMYATYNPDIITDKLKVAQCPQTEGYILRKSYAGLCCMPTMVGGTATTRFSDYMYTNAATSKGLRVRAAGGGADTGTGAGASCSHTNYTATDTRAGISSPLCYFVTDPAITVA